MNYSDILYVIFILNQMSLVDSIKTGIAKKDIVLLYKLKDICDRIHATGDVYNEYGPEDLPSDILYEEMVKLINDNAVDLKIVTHKNIGLNSSYIRKDGLGVSSNEINHMHDKHIHDLWMGSITKLTEIKDIPDAILLPKFDGCSCGVRLKRSIINNEFEVVEALTRGTEEGFITKKSNITEKFNRISDLLLKNLSSPEISQYILLNGRRFSEITSLTLRGEIVLKDKNITPSAPASYIAGKINGYIEVWENALDNIEFIPYEFIRCYFSDNKRDIYIPTQIETINILSQAKLFNYPYEICELSESSSEYIEKHFNKLSETLSEPIDGVVYCSTEWKYPLHNEETKPKAYGKFAWKPNSEATSVLREVDCTLSRDGKFNFILIYDPVNIKGKSYRQAKTATSRLQLLHGIGIGSVITIKLAGDISPMVVDYVEDSNITAYELPTSCPFCNEKTLLKNGKTPTLSCTNLKCKEILKQKMINFIKIIGIKGIAEGKLNQLQTISFESLHKKYLMKVLDLKNILRNIDTRTFMMALGIGGKNKITNLIPSGINPTLSIYDNLDSVMSVLNKYYDSDPFVKDIIDYTYNILFDIK